MYIHTRKRSGLASMHVFTYRGIKLDYVDKCKYVGVWVDSNCSFETQAK